MWHRLASFAVVLGAGLLAAGAAHLSTAQTSVSSAFDHFTTAFPLVGVHQFAACESCHADGQFDGTPLQCGGCHTQGSRAQATFKPARHSITSEYCEGCHSSIGWSPVMRVDHAEALDTCSGCHDGARAAGKPASHIPAGEQCGDCHRTGSWTPAVFEHEGISSGCVVCHDGRTALGKPAMHIPAGNTCEDCHNVMLFSPVTRVDHLQVIGTCSTCHNGTVARGQFVGHIPTVDECDTCHNTTTWER